MMEIEVTQGQAFYDHENNRTMVIDGFVKSTSDDRDGYADDQEMGFARCYTPLGEDQYPRYFYPLKQVAQNIAAGFPYLAGVKRGFVTTIITATMQPGEAVFSTWGYNDNRLYASATKVTFAITDGGVADAWVHFDSRSVRDDSRHVMDVEFKAVQ